MYDKLLRYFDITIPGVADATAAGDSSADVQAVKVHWFPQWLALLLGIILQPSFSHYQQTHIWKFPAFPGWIFFSIIVAIMIFPGIYRNSFDPEKPIVIQIIPLFIAGMGWQSLLTTVLQ
ncbi:hypothetical protein [Singulisphaera sp. PoT]|uniref:hypothetical protein n=1 Tax=Singulisphaera sp. PoT TaxID=3411797 RepID=UPI003BF4870F